MKKMTVVVAAIVLVCPNVFADQITLKNGDRLTGDIVKSDGKTLVIKSEFAGEVAVQWAAIDTITSTQTLHVGLKDGRRSSERQPRMTAKCSCRPEKRAL